MTTSASGRSACRFGGFLSVILLVTMALLVAAPGTSEAKTQLWLYPDVDDPRAGGHVVTHGEFMLVVENRGRGDDDTAYDVSLVVAVNDLGLLADGSVTLIWPGGEETIVSGDLQPGTPWRPCDEKLVPRHGIYPADYTTVPIFNTGSPTTDPAAEILAGDTVEIEVVIVGADGLEVHFDAIAQGFKMKKETEVCYGVVNPSGHDVTVILGEAVEAECPAVTVDKSADITGVDIDDEVVFTIEVESSVDCDPLGGVIVTENLPTVIDPETGNPVPAFTVMEVDPPPDDLAGDPITWTLTSVLAPGVPAIFTVTVAFDQPLTDGHKVVNTACVALVGNEDPEECSRAVVAVGEQANDGEIGGPGFWCNRIRFALEDRHNATYTEDELEAFLDEINKESSVFAELFEDETFTLAEAQTLLCHPQLAESAADRLTRHLLTLWFNIVSERIDPDQTLDELCPGDEELPDDLPEDFESTMTVGDVIIGAEEALWADELDDAPLDWWKDIIDFINNSDCNDVDEPAAQMRRSQGRRVGRH